MIESTPGRGKNRPNTKFEGFRNYSKEARQILANAIFTAEQEHLPDLQSLRRASTKATLPRVNTEVNDTYLRIEKCKEIASIAAQILGFELTEEIMKEVVTSSGLDYDKVPNEVSRISHQFRK